MVDTSIIETIFFQVFICKYIMVISTLKITHKSEEKNGIPYTEIDSSNELHQNIAVFKMLEYKYLS